MSILKSKLKISFWKNFDSKKKKKKEPNLKGNKLTLNSSDSPAQNNFAFEVVLHSLVRVWLPPPHVVEHPDQSDQGEKVGQGSMLHLSVSFKGALHGFESPSITFVKFKPHSRIRERSPPPQVTLQVLQAAQGPKPKISSKRNDFIITNGSKIAILLKTKV